MLHVVMYHYVREPRTNPLPALKAMDLGAFRRQVKQLAAQFEMATLETAVKMLEGRYQPSRDLCLLTFDDGLKEHYRDVTPFLAEQRIQGVFAAITGCLEERRMATVHMSHVLMAYLGFHQYSNLFLRELEYFKPGFAERLHVDSKAISRTYAWDSLEVAWFKYLVNFALDALTSDTVVRSLFTRYLGDEHAFAADFYINWNEAASMLRDGMVIAGHSHRHRPLASLDPAALLRDLSSCRSLLSSRLRAQPLLPFCYPYGKRSSFAGQGISLLKQLGFCCSFSTESGPNQPGEPLFAIRRVDCKQAPVSEAVPC